MKACARKDRFEHIMFHAMRAILFGGAGFIGAHYARLLLETHPDAQILICDHNDLHKDRYASSLTKALETPRCSFRRIDLRRRIPDDLVDGRVDLIANFAAVHREPGHEPGEYFDTNLSGAENVCDFAERVDCRTILFTSSISPYGPSFEERSETSLTIPVTPYGSSKLAAEKIHVGWQRGGDGRKLLIVRPGVVFGAGEGGNVTRMIRFLRKGLFFYFGNRQIRKSGIFVKSLCEMFEWGLSRLSNPDLCNHRPGVILFNASFDPPPSVEEYVRAIKTVGGFRRPVLAVPFSLLYWVSHFFMGLGGIHPVRVRKLIRPNLILPGYLREAGYRWNWTLESALQDWKREKPEDWA